MHRNLADISRLDDVLTEAKAGTAAGLALLTLVAYETRRVVLAARE